MVTAATFAACNWILDHFKGICRHYMDGNMTTDKKTSTINTLLTRGKRVTAEVILKRDLLIEHLRVDPEACEYYMKVSSLGTFIDFNNKCMLPTKIRKCTPSTTPNDNLLI
jgi:hydroxymethylglutaryl-CoA reductase (NADPH)